jgi:hypothetical protein
MEKADSNSVAQYRERRCGNCRFYTAALTEQPYGKQFGHCSEVETELTVDANAIYSVSGKVLVGENFSCKYFTVNQ